MQARVLTRLLRQLARPAAVQREAWAADFLKVLHAYAEAGTLDTQWESRVPLYNLYHLLNHLNLFGRSYLGEVQTILRRFG